MARKTKLEADDELTNIIRLLQTKLANQPTILLSGTTWARTDLIALFQAVLDAEAKTRSARAAWRTMVANERSARARAVPVRNALRTQLESTYGEGSPMVLALGIASKKRKKPSVETRVAAIEKRQATRAARNTMGTKRRKQIKGPPEDATKTK